MIYLQISTAQGPAECRIFARFVLGRLLAEAKAEGVEVEIISETADKHGMMSAVLKLDGKYAETLAQRWQGSLQWICASPVRPKHPRKNWYIGVFRMPDMPEMPSESEIEFQTCRSGGKGGQHVNKTESAVRITHMPSGIVVQCQNDRSQHKNKDQAMKQLKAKLYELELQKKNADKQAMEDNKSDIGWGSQIRSYVLDDARIKDLRTGVENRNTQAVLDGDLDRFIEASLKAGL